LDRLPGECFQRLCDNDAWATSGGRPCENIIIRNCHFVYGEPGGVSIGSEMSGDVRNVFVENCRMDYCDYALFVKANPDRGGIVENFHVRNVSVQSCGYLLRVEMNYKNLERGKAMPLFRDFSVQRVTAQKAGKGGISFYGLPQATMQNLMIKDVHIATAAIPLEMRHLRNVRFENVAVNGQPCRFLPRTFLN
jgi:polygalacturonase